METITNNDEDIWQLSEGIKVLAIDDNLDSLTALTNLLNNCGCQVTSVSNKAEALELLKLSPDNFDIVLTNDYIDELDIPVVMISAGEDDDIVNKNLSRNGAVKYLIKPVRYEDVENLWQYIALKQSDVIDFGLDLVTTSENGNLSEEHANPVNTCDAEDVQGGVETGTSSKKGLKRKGHVGGKKERMKWDEALHDKFLKAVETLGGIDKAVPKKILELLIDEPGLTREHVASHLQKYRKFLKKELNRDQNKNIDNNNNNKFVNYYQNVPGPPSTMGSSLMASAPCPHQQPNLDSTMLRGVPMALNYQHQHQPDNSNRIMLTPTIGYPTPQLLEFRPNQSFSHQPKMMPPPTNANFFDPSSNLVFRQPSLQFTQARSFGSGPNIMYDQPYQQPTQGSQFGSVPNVFSQPTQQPSQEGLLNPDDYTTPSHSAHFDHIFMPF